MYSKDENNLTRCTCTFERGRADVILSKNGVVETKVSWSDSSERVRAESVWLMQAPALMKMAVPQGLPGQPYWNRRGEANSRRVFEGLWHDLTGSQEGIRGRIACESLASECSDNIGMDGLSRRCLPFKWR
jgi:hypothetical protein